MIFNRNFTYRLNFLILLICLLIYQPGKAQVSAKLDIDGQHWVDSVYYSLSPQQRIGQLFMLRANSETDSTEIRLLSRL